MVLKHFYQKNENRIIAAGLIFIIAAFIAWRYDYYFYLNDDVVMNDIMSGAYTGVAEGRNIQMMYPLSLLISLLYRIFPQVPVYGLFLWLCQFGCLYLIVERSLSFRSRTVSKILAAVLEGMIITVLLLEHLVFVQYSVTSALLAAAAAFLFITTKESISVRQFIVRNIVSIILVLLAFSIRSEMLIMMMPFIGVAGIYKWAGEGIVFARGNIRKYCTVIISILAGIIIIYGMNSMAYRGDDWKTFMRFFDSRTELYDFQGIPSYKENIELYNELGITESQYSVLLDQYNFGLDEDVDSVLLDKLSSYQKQSKRETSPFAEELKGALGEYRHRIIHKEPAGSKTPDDYPFNIMIVFGYICVFIAGIWGSICNEDNREGRQQENTSEIMWKSGWKILLLAIVRTMVWLYILVRGRDPIRITHSLYIMELCILWAMLYIESQRLDADVYKGIKATVVFPIMMVLTVAVTLPVSITDTNHEYANREIANITYRGVKEYCKIYPENFYFIDVYSFVSDPESLMPYSGKLFESTGNGLQNYDIMGGWLVKSPLHKKKLQKWGIASIGDSLIDNGNVYLMAELDKGTDFLRDYYMDENIMAEAQLVDTINGVIGVYKMSAE